MLRRSSQLFIVSASQALPVGKTAGFGVETSAAAHTHSKRHHTERSLTAAAPTSYANMSFGHARDDDHLFHSSNPADAVHERLGSALFSAGDNEPACVKNPNPHDPTRYGDWQYGGRATDF